MLKRPATVAGAIIGLYVASALLVTAIMPRPHHTLTYLVAGAFATCVCLGAGFYMHVRTVAGRTAQRNEQSS